MCDDQTPLLNLTNMPLIYQGSILLVENSKTTEAMN